MIPTILLACAIQPQGDTVENWIREYLSEDLQSQERAEERLLSSGLSARQALFKAISESPQSDSRSKLVQLLQKIEEANWGSIDYEKFMADGTVLSLALDANSQIKSGDKILLDPSDPNKNELEPFLQTRARDAIEGIRQKHETHYWILVRADPSADFDALRPLFQTASRLSAAPGLALAIGSEPKVVFRNWFVPGAESTIKAIHVFLCADPNRRFDHHTAGYRGSSFASQKSSEEARSAATIWAWVELDFNRLLKLKNGDCESAELNGLISRIKFHMTKDKASDIPIAISADPEVSWKNVVGLLDALNEAKLNRVQFVATSSYRPGQ